MNGNIKKCVQCGTEMKALKSTKCYCSDACKQAAFYVRSAEALGAVACHTGDIQERIILSRRIYCYTIKLGGAAPGSYNYDDQSARSLSKTQSGDVTGQLLTGILSGDKKEELDQTIFSSGIYGILKPGRSYNHKAYKQVIPVNDVGLQGTITNSEPEVANVNKEPHKPCHFRRPCFRLRHISNTPDPETHNGDYTFNVTEGSRRIREPS